MTVVVTISELIELILIGLFIVGVIGYILYMIIADWFNKHFRKNCYKCKHWKLESVAGSGYNCCYICEKHNKAYAQEMNNHERYTNCKEYQEVDHNES